MEVQLRNEVSWAKNAKMVRIGVYDVGIVLGAILLSGKTDTLAQAVKSLSLGVPSSPETVAVSFALLLWIGMVFIRYRDWHAVERIEKGLDPMNSSGRWGGGWRSTS